VSPNFYIFFFFDLILHRQLLIKYGDRLRAHSRYADSPSKSLELITTADNDVQPLSQTAYITESSIELRFPRVSIAKLKIMQSCATYQYASIGHSESIYLSEYAQTRLSRVALVLTGKLGTARGVPEA
jgi:hypothetical protein